MNRTCKKQFTTPKNMSSDEARLRILCWLVEGLKIPEHKSKGRELHLKINPRTLCLQTEVALVTVAEAAWSYKQKPQTVFEVADSFMLGVRMQYLESKVVCVVIALGLHCPCYIGLHHNIILLHFHLALI
jgi:hypothetical protein